MLWRLGETAQEQSSALQQINIAVNQMDQDTQKNAAVVEESTAASHSLAQEVQSLHQLLAQFKLDRSGHSAPVRPASGRNTPTVSPARALGRKLASAFSGNAAVDISKGNWEEFKVEACRASSLQSLEIIAFMLSEPQFCVRTTSIRKIRGWAPVTPSPHTPAEVLGAINWRGTVIPIIDLSTKLGMPATMAKERSAIVVTNVKGRTIGLMVDGVSDILTVSPSELQPVPPAAGIVATGYAEGILAHGKQMICFLNLEAIFAGVDPSDWEDAA